MKDVDCRIESLTRGAKLLRENPDLISHEALVEMVADWIDGEANMWAVMDHAVNIINSLEVEGKAAARVDFVATEDGRVHCKGDTSSHAEKIIAAVKVKL